MIQPSGMPGDSCEGVGRLGDALETARKALRVARERNQQELVRALSGSVASYEAALGSPAVRP